MLHLECDQLAHYMVLDESADDEWIEYRGPVRLSAGESIAACCGTEFNLLAHPLRVPSAAARASAVPQPTSSSRRPSVLVVQLGDISRARFRRSMPKTIDALGRI